VVGCLGIGPAVRFHMVVLLLLGPQQVSNALHHLPHCIKYMKGLRDRDVFRFCAIPQIMAIGTLALCYNNGQVFEGERCGLLLSHMLCRLLTCMTTPLWCIMHQWRAQQRVPHDALPGSCVSDSLGLGPPKSVARKSMLLSAWGAACTFTLVLFAAARCCEDAAWADRSCI
jgi:hypothetical protein